MITFESVSKAYAGNKVYAVHDVTFEAKAGEIFGFLGPNGAGKTTSIKMMTGILQPTSGTVKICGYDIVKEPIEAKRRIGFVPDNQVLYAKLTGREYVDFICNIYGVPMDVRKERADKLLEKFNLTKDFDQSISTYSHGMAQKISVIAALIHDPEVWILDEPMTGLDPQSSFELKQMMREHTDSGKTVLFSTHVLEVAEKVCDRIGIINRGRILAVGTIDEMRAAFGTDLESAFLKMIENDNLQIAQASAAQPMAADADLAAESAQETKKVMTDDGKSQDNQ